MSRAGRRRGILVALALAVTFPASALALAFPASALAARPLELGFGDGVYTGSHAASWLRRSVQAGADVVRITIEWPAIAPKTLPHGFDARNAAAHTHNYYNLGFNPDNPADPGYHFSGTDAAIRAAHGLGLGVILVFTGAPAWAEARGGPPAAEQAGTWRPQPKAIEAWGIALGKRYSGHFPDPLHGGQTLPRVAAFQVWNEPNLSEYLTPQWSGGQMASPGIYRQMLNAFYAGVKSVDRGALVVTAGTAPFGDPFVGGQRIPPVPFWQDLLCLRQVAGRLTGTHCANPAHFDVLAHHPYSIGAPGTAALDPGDVSIADIGKLARLLRAAERSGRALPRERHPIWVTEVGYNTKPPNPGGVPLAEDARWVEQTLEILWRQGVSTICWNQVVDQPPIPNYGASNQSGVYFVNGKPKPGPLLAFRFPFVASRLGGSTVQAWGRVPVKGRLVIERHGRSGWREVRSFSERAGSTFLTNITVHGKATLRAQIGSTTSIPWGI